MYKPRDINAKVYLAICDECRDVRIEGKHKKPFYCNACGCKVNSKLWPYKTALAIRQDILKDSILKEEKL